ncbi:MAG: hypothetical protein LBR41_02650 [Rickettsiales bacterium]|jgi:hypothetical protein|nr:hypothetical protein [Rickettsiales bacterium]
MITFNINDRIFDCEFVEQQTDGTLIYRQPITDAENRPYFIAQRGDLKTYSHSLYRAVGHLNRLQFCIEFEQRPLNLDEKIDIETFEFMYRRATGACTHFRRNLGSTIWHRTVPTDNIVIIFSLQHWACLSIRRHNFKSFIQWLERVGRTADQTPNPVHVGHNCSVCGREYAMAERDDTGR